MAKRKEDQRSLGGGDARKNLQTMCIPCNCRKGARF